VGEVHASHASFTIKSNGEIYALKFVDFSRSYRQNKFAPFYGSRCTFTVAILHLHDTTTAIGITNKYIADIQTNVLTGDKPLEFWLNTCPKAYSQLSVLAIDLLAAPASQASVERLFSVLRNA